MSDYISQDTVAEIFKYLPVRSLLRFRRVCKWWKEVIDSPTFLQQHLALQKPRLLIEYEEPDFLAVDPTTLLVRTLRRPLGIGQGAILGTLHGVVCLHNWRRYLVIWNPSMRKSSIITLPLDFPWDNLSNKERQTYGFWIDPSTKEFKIIILLFITEDDNDEPCVDGILYSSIRHDWRVIPSGELRNWQSCHEGAPVMMGDVAHWVGWYDQLEKDDQGNSLKAKAILSFDFRLESFEFIEMTDLSYLPLIHPVPCRWQGSLSLLCCDHSFPYTCDVYSRQQGSWVKMFGFKLFAPIVRVFGLLEDNGRVVASIRGDWDTTRGDLVLYDPKIGRIPLKTGLRYCNNVYMAYDFVESLLFP